MKRILLLCFTIGLCLNICGQAKKQPSVMVIPSDVWCFKNGFSKTFSDNGESKKVADYERALAENSHLRNVIAAINDMMAGAGFPLKNLEQELKKISNSRARDIALSSKTGASVTKSTLDIVMSKAKPDIIFSLDWTINQMGPRTSVTYTLEAVDAYTSLSIGAAGPVAGGWVVTTNIDALLREAVQASMGHLQDRMSEYFDDIRENGRIITLEVGLWDNCPFDFEEEYGGVELKKLIKKWVKDNSVNGAFETTDFSETYLQFNPVRIALYDEFGDALDANDWADGLRSYLKTLGITTKSVHGGLGNTYIIVGGK
jgi:hypothetical protein